jgi:hypothetical protein
MSSCAGHYLNGVASKRVISHTTLSGLIIFVAVDPGSPLCGQPWADGWNPFGILEAAQAI